MSYHRLLFLILLAFLFACTSEDTTETQDTAATTEDTQVEDTQVEDTQVEDTQVEDTQVEDTQVEDTQVEGPFLTIVVAGSLEDRAPNDGLGAQTPNPYAYGLQRLEMLRTPDDADPAVIFDHNPDVVMVDMHGRTEVARVPMSTLPLGTFNYFRIYLTLLDADVDARIHGLPVIGSTDAKLNIRYALGATTIDGTARNQGDVVVSTTIAGQPITWTDHWPMDYPQPAPNAWAEARDQRTLVTLALDPPLLIAPLSPIDLTYVTTYYIADSFRWQNVDGNPSFSDAWDIVSGTEPSAEEVIRFGANAYEVAPE